MIRRICNGVFLTVLLCMLAFRVAAASQGNIRVVTRGGTVALYRVGDFEDTHPIYCHRDRRCCSQ